LARQVMAACAPRNQRSCCYLVKRVVTTVEWRAKVARHQEANEDNEAML